MQSITRHVHTVCTNNLISICTHSKCQVGSTNNKCYQNSEDRDVWVGPILLGGHRTYLKNIRYLDKLIIGRSYNRSEQQRKQRLCMACFDQYDSREALT